MTWNRITLISGKNQRVELEPEEKHGKGTGKQKE